MSSGDEQEEVPDINLADAKVQTKIRTAGDIANKGLQFAADKIKPGAKIIDICIATDAFLVEQTGKIYNKGGIKKGIAFPCCISVNHAVGHFSPLPGDESVIPEEGIAKIDLGVQIDGYAAVVAHTVSVDGKTISGRAADAVNAAYLAANCVYKSLKLGEKNDRITDIIKQCADEFKCNPVSGVLSHQMGRYDVDGEKVVQNRDDPENKVDECEFEQNEVWVVDIVISTGEGKPYPSEERTTVFKRNPDTSYSLKLKASRAVFGEIQKVAEHYPFNIRVLDAKKAKVGIKEMSDHGLVEPYPVLYEKSGEYVAQVKFTLLLPGTKSQKITGLPSPATDSFTVKSQELQNIVNGAGASGAKKKKKKKKKKAAQ
jgi:curved DNA binding protein